MIRLEHVSKTYQQGVPALNDVSIHIEQGEFVFIMGKSGSGKSTLIKLLLKELEPTKGEIYINNQKLSSVTHKRYRISAEISVLYSRISAYYRIVMFMKM